MSASQVFQGAGLSPISSTSTDTRICTNCKIEKPLDNYWKDSGRSKGHDYRCIPCKKIEQKEYAKTNGYKKALRKSHLKTRYGVNPEDVPNSCQVCDSIDSICVDHNHDTGAIRGFLCRPCNSALGLIKDNPETLRKLASYLEK